MTSKARAALRTPFVLGAVATLLGAPVALVAQQPTTRSSIGDYQVAPPTSYLLRRDAPVAGSGAPDPSLANAFNFVTSTGVNLNGVAVYQTPIPNVPGLYATCTATRIGARTLLTAAHCVTDEATGAVFRTARQGGAVFIAPTSTEAKPRYVATPAPVSVRVRSEWQGFSNSQLQYDVAVVNFKEALPDYITQYDLFSGDALGQATTHVGFGTFGTGVGATGFDFGRRWGTNRVDAIFTDPKFTDANVLYTDFDGAGFDSFCALGIACDSGANTEAGIASGDSGGPLFINGALAGVTSFGTYLCGPGSTPTKCVPYVADPSRPFNSFGALNGFAPISVNSAFISAAIIPEPSTVMLLGGGLVVTLGGAWRRRAR